MVLRWWANYDSAWTLLTLPTSLDGSYGRSTLPLSPTPIKYASTFFVSVSTTGAFRPRFTNFPYEMQAFTEMLTIVDNGKLRHGGVAFSDPTRTIAAEASYKMMSAVLPSNTLPSLPSMRMESDDSAEDLLRALHKRKSMDYKPLAVEFLTNNNNDYHPSLHPNMSFSRPMSPQTHQPVLYNPFETIATAKRQRNKSLDRPPAAAPSQQQPRPVAPVSVPSSPSSPPLSTINDDSLSVGIEPVAAVQIANRIVQSKKGGKGENKYLQLSFDCRKLLTPEMGYKKDQEATLNSYLFDRSSKTFKFPNNLDIRLDNKKMILSLKLKLPKKGQLIGFSHDECRILCHLRIGNTVVARGYSNTFTIVCRKDQIKDEDVIVTRESRHQSKKDKDGTALKFEATVRHFLSEASDMTLSEKKTRMMMILDRVTEEFSLSPNCDSERSSPIHKSSPTLLPTGSPSPRATPTIYNSPQHSTVMREYESQMPGDMEEREEGAKAIAMLASLDKSSKEEKEKTRRNSFPPHLYGCFGEAFGGQSYLFVCHDLSFNVFGSLRDATRSKWYNVNGVVMIMTVITFAVQSYSGFFLFYHDVKSNILSNFPATDVPANVARILLLRAQSVPLFNGDTFLRFTEDKHGGKDSQHLIVVLSALLIAEFVTDLGVKSTVWQEEWPQHRFQGHIDDVESIQYLYRLEDFHVGWNFCTSISGVRRNCVKTFGSIFITAKGGIEQPPFD
ncbi:hypothetical protein PROFUN_02994 [Planoprotostelium fungivorum]|uniref:Amino acid transporter transmembrane domain-containing protein n=1 Tax=Planoprotostelium fungivorum TaxID=1890364 RepID=A0A2P6NX95_9EUKA|nr:hypothetical protein PROFUN_02994 [Planoprotostelium fungivorum]